MVDGEDEDVGNGGVVVVGHQGYSARCSIAHKFQYLWLTDETNIGYKCQSQKLLSLLYNSSTPQSATLLTTLLQETGSLHNEHPHKTILITYSPT